MSAEVLSRLHADLADQVAAGAVPGLVAAVVCGDETEVLVIGTQGLDDPTPMRPDTIFRISSLTKPIVAFAALQMVEEGVFGLDEPVEGLLPELAGLRVLRSLSGPVDDTVAAERPILVRDLLTFTAGFGQVMAPPGTYPIQAELDRAPGAPGPPQPARTVAPDEYLAALAALPLLHQPGAQWMYNTASDVLGVLMARAAGATLQQVLQQRLFGALALRDTGFCVPSSKIDRLATSYQPGPTGGLELFDPAEGGQWTSPPPLESGAGGLVSTAEDLLAFTRLMLGRGVFEGRRLLSEELFTAMTTDQLTEEQKQNTISMPGFFDTHGWGYGLSVRTVAGDGEPAGSFGWSGGLGTYWAATPGGSAGILLTQRAMTSPEPEPLVTQFWSGVWAAGAGQPSRS
ncbi:beta-lactamase family protein [Kineosporia rhizophila]|uniref:serine hydrolase domain-containing protein n=1 Tax=Kineosporia TaxID=49184 RepID=UPI001E3E7F37|nr:MULTISPECIES: serine hydrolase domain-containing protein [Kineosporia]MCE0539597.1 beta-lactamase family protein [Kineosporia rhizophila]